MIKRRGGSQIGNLTIDHKSLESMGQMSSDWNMLYTVGKIFLRAIRFYLFILKKKNLIWKIYEPPKFWDNKSPNFGTLTWESRGKVTFGCNPCRKAHNILWGREWCILPKVVGHVKLVFEVVPTKFVTPLPFNLHQLPSFIGCASWPHLELSLVSSS
jgi:hypothetical protein